MSRIGIRITTVGAAAAGLATAFLAMSPTAAADPVAPVAPGAGAVDAAGAWGAPPKALAALCSICGILSGAAASC